MCDIIKYSNYAKIEIYFYINCLHIHLCGLFILKYKAVTVLAYVIALIDY